LRLVPKAGPGLSVNRLRGQLFHLVRICWRAFSRSSGPQRLRQERLDLDFSPGPLRQPRVSQYFARFVRANRNSVVPARPNPAR
jgi:hypothetical protein